MTSSLQFIYVGQRATECLYLPCMYLADWITFILPQRAVILTLRNERNPPDKPETCASPLLVSNTRFTLSIGSFAR